MTSTASLRPSVGLTVPAVLRRAAEGYRTGEITWGAGWFHDRGTDCRCLLGAITWAVNPNDPDGDPFFVGGPGSEARLLAIAAATALAEYLVEAGIGGAVHEDGSLDVVETVGGYNDEPGRRRGDVLLVLEAAAVRAERAAA